MSGCMLHVVWLMFTDMVSRRDSEIEVEVCNVVYCSKLHSID